MHYRFQITDDLMTIVDDENNGHDAVVITQASYDAGDLDSWIDMWAAEFGIDAAAAKAELAGLMAEWKDV